MIGLGVVASCAHLLITRSLKLAPASLLAPLQVQPADLGGCTGNLFFGDVPDLYVITGGMIIVVAGLFIFHRRTCWKQCRRRLLPRRPLILLVISAAKRQPA